MATGICRDPTPRRAALITESRLRPNFRPTGVFRARVPDRYLKASAAIKEEPVVDGP